jgi:hypothetical protein
MTTDLRGAIRMTHALIEGGALSQEGTDKVFALIDRIRESGPVEPFDPEDVAIFVDTMSRTEIAAEGYYKGIFRRRKNAVEYERQRLSSSLYRRYARARRELVLMGVPLKEIARMVAVRGCARRAEAMK